MDTFQVTRSVEGKFDVVDSAGVTHGHDLSTRAEAATLINRIQNAQIVEDIFRRTIRLEFARITEDYKVDRRRALEILREETNKLSQPQPKTTVMSFIQNE